MIVGQLHAAAARVRDAGLVKSVDQLLAQLRGPPALLLDLLIESHPDRDDGGAATPAAIHGPKLETHAAFYVADADAGPGPGGGGGRPRVDSMARLTLYGTARKRVAILSAVVTRRGRRRAGLATRTVGALVRKCCPPGVPVRLTCTDANAGFYARLGFEEKAGGYMELKT